MLAYENEMFLTAMQEDGLTIAAKVSCHQAVLKLSQLLPQGAAWSPLRGGGRGQPGAVAGQHPGGRHYGGARGHAPGLDVSPGRQGSGD